MEMRPYVSPPPNRPPARCARRSRHVQGRGSWLPLVVLAACLSGLHAAPARGEAAVEARAGERAAKLLETVRTQKPEELWETVNALVRLGQADPAVQPRLEWGVQQEDERTQLAAACALQRLKRAGLAAPAFQRLVAKGGTAEIRRLAASALALGPLLDEDDATPSVLREALKREPDALTRIAISRTLWRVCGSSDGKAALVELWHKAREGEVRDEAVLSLAEMGYLAPPRDWPAKRDEVLLREVHARVDELRGEPTARGERAFRLYREMEDNDLRAGDLKKVVQGERLLREVLGWIAKAYIEPAKCDVDRFFENAARGLVATLDPFSQYLSREEAQATLEALRGDYGGIGAFVGLQDGAFRVTSPIFNSPAERAGLRAGDIILKVDGENAQNLIRAGGQAKAISKLKGPVGTTVKVTYTRRGFQKPVDVDIVREKIVVQNIYSAPLPGGLGYVRLTRFGERTIEELDAALADLLQKRKVKGLVFDLRDSPGGLLRTGVEVADRFLDGGKQIVYSEGRPEFSPRKPFYSTGAPNAGKETYPLVVLVNAGTASAAEIVAGALQDLKRATLVGEKTYGKGSVQQIIPLRATQGETQLRLTIAKYYLPSGRSIHEVGVKPDVTARNAEPEDWALREIQELRQKNTVEDYVRGQWAREKTRLLALAEDDGGRAEAYPGFAEFQKSVAATRLSDNDLRGEIRRTVRRLAEQELRREFACDLETDEVLQRGVWELLGKLKVDASTIAQYKGYPAKFAGKALTEPAVTDLPPPDGGAKEILPEERTGKE